ncbi:N-acetylneuraminate synthase [Halorubrum sp. SY-15]|uniref:N-acetylneuraminate synthase n=1 Tax=Halorubrum sp. SY-15 TaxID=3402277 RepID=UPI003EC0579A
MEIDDITLDEDTVYFIAEAGVNHNGSLETAKKLIDAAATSGADAVKFQTFSADRLVTKDASKVDYQSETTGDGSQYEMLKRYELDRKAHEQLIEHCNERDITFLSTPFDSESADMLADLGVSAIKIGSGELDNHPLLEHVAGLGLPLIVSTGMSTMDEVHAAQDVIRSVDHKLDVIFLHCTSAYPCSLDDVNFRAMRTMIDELDEPVGYSDHTTLPETPAFAVAAGAVLVEKHFTLDISLAGPDQETSLEPAELTRSVALARDAFRSRGCSVKKVTEAERVNRSAVRKSIHAATDLREGAILTEANTTIIRPADGLSPTVYESILGSKITEDLSEGDPVLESVLNSDVGSG